MATEMNSVNWFEIPVSDLARAKSFYETVLGVELAPNEMGPLKMAWFPMHQGAPGAAGALVLAEGYRPSPEGTMVYFHVEDIEAVLKKINAQGGQTLLSKSSIGEYGYIAHFLDSEGNRAALHCET